MARMHIGTASSDKPLKSNVWTGSLDANGRPIMTDERKAQLRLELAAHVAAHPGETITFFLQDETGGQAIDL